MVDRDVKFSNLSLVFIQQMFGVFTSMRPKTIKIEQHVHLEDLRRIKQLLVT